MNPGSQILTIRATPTKVAIDLLAGTAQIDMRAHGTANPVLVSVGDSLTFTVSMQANSNKARVTGVGDSMVPWRALWFALRDGSDARFEMSPSLTITHLNGLYSVQCSRRIATYLTFRVIPQSSGGGAGGSTQSSGGGGGNCSV